MNEDMTLKFWHDEDLTYHEEVKIPFSHCTPDGNFSWQEFLRMTSDCAGNDFTWRDMDWKFLQEKGLVIILSRISYHVYKMPVYTQRIKINTWESAPQGPLCTRNFCVVDGTTDEKLISGQTLWTIVDLKNQKLMPAKAYPYRPTPTIVTDFEGVKPGKISIPEGMEIIGKRTVMYSDLDANGHTNNSKYINFVIDALPAEFQKKTLKDLRLNYSKEAHLGDELTLKAFFNAEENKYTVQGIVGEISSFEAELYY